MAGFTKLSSSIIHSTIWRESNHIRVCWVTLLAMADKDGVVEASVPGLADAARITIDECQEALNKFQSPDKWSRSQECAGRRIEEIRGGWRLINHGRYRESTETEKEERRKSLARERKRRQREKTEEERDCHAGHADVTQCHAYPDTEADPDTDAESDPEINKKNNNNIEQKKEGEVESCNGQVEETDTDSLSDYTKFIRDTILASWPEYGEEKALYSASAISQRWPHPAPGDSVKASRILTDAKTAWPPNRTVYERNGLHGYLVAFFNNAYVRYETQEGRKALKLPKTDPWKLFIDALELNRSIDGDDFKQLYNDCIYDGSVPAPIDKFVKKLISVGTIETINELITDVWSGLYDPETLLKGPPEPLDPNQLSELLQGLATTMSSPDSRASPTGKSLTDDELAALEAASERI